MDRRNVVAGVSENAHQDMPLDLPLSSCLPRSMLMTADRDVGRVKFSAVDIHQRLGRWLTPDDSSQARCYGLYVPFLETADEYPSYGPGNVPDQGRSYIYGADLPDYIVRPVYHDATSLLHLETISHSLLRSSAS